MSVEITADAAVRLQSMARAAGIVGMPGVRLWAAKAAGPDTVELIIEDRREPGDEVFVSRGIRFYVSGETATDIGDVVVDLRGADFVIRQVPQPR